ncbi:Tetratricopeptide-like helical domain,HAT (Half-A-TPR) repeat [Cinara cedri]|uniref:Tetratricopeptide-like helical domain,HAT (Half-A-TPR) repeat n=1 Tax=Cinara cedri TaxID=506608 RepID=A0A5E4NQL9_9HEMI|nr:Tetratricopeptide-like helical domain,HAT (Half-A-TPR) repeat [Cinara cedri]
MEEDEGNFITTHKIISSEELKKLKDHRKSFYNNIANGSVTEQQSLKQIKFESRLLNSCRFKIDQLKRENKNNSVNTELLKSFANRINDMYIIFFNSFKFDLFMISDYVQFGMQNKCLTTKCIHVLDDLMSRCRVSPEVYICCAHYAFYVCDDITATRRFLSNAVKFHPKYQNLYTEEFCIEIQYMDKMGGTSASDKYQHYIKLFKDDMNFHFSLVDTILKFNAVTTLHCLVVSDMVKIYCHSELMWQNLAKINLKGFAYNFESCDKNIYYVQDDLQCISNCFGTYEKGLEKDILAIDVHQRLWNLFLDEMMNINDSPRVNNTIIKDYVNNKIEQIFYRACSENKIRKPDYFIFWANHSKNNELIILQKSVEALPDNIILWNKLLSYFVSHDNYNAIMETLNKAVDILQNNSLPLWEVAELYMMNVDDCYLEQFYEQTAIVEPYSDINKVFRLKYLKWRTLRFGIKSGRSIFNKLYRLEPKSLDLYKQMIAYENNHNYPRNKKYIRYLYSEACSEFGAKNIDIWADCMRFEYACGVPIMVDKIYNASRVFLEPNLFTALGELKNRLDIEFQSNTEVIEIDSD